MASDCSMTEDALLPCPFCGGDGIAIEDRSDATDTVFLVGCSEPSCPGYGASVETAAEFDTDAIARDEAMRAWNVRAVLF